MYPDRQTTLIPGTASLHQVPDPQGQKSTGGDRQVNVTLQDLHDGVIRPILSSFIRSVLTVCCHVSGSVLISEDRVEQNRQKSLNFWS